MSGRVGRGRSGRAGGGGERIDVVAALAALPEEQRGTLIRSLPLPMRRELAERWQGGWAQAGQAPPDGDWRIWLIRAGRGFGKTRAGAEWVTATLRQSRTRRSRWSARPLRTCAG